MLLWMLGGMTGRICPCVWLDSNLRLDDDVEGEGETEKDPQGNGILFTHNLNSSKKVYLE